MSERYVPDQAAVDWARAAVERLLARMEAHHEWLRAADPDAAEGFRKAFWFLRRELIGGQGCVIAAFDQRLPEVERLTRTGRPWVDRSRTTHDRAGGPPLAPPVRAARSPGVSPPGDRASNRPGGAQPASTQPRASAALGERRPGAPPGNIVLLVRMSPAHPSWHVQLPGHDATACGREVPDGAVTEPWRGALPAKTCTRCAAVGRGLPTGGPS